jgi:charged multivesicular body protein 6
VVQEINDMLGGKMSNQDEEEVEDELAAMEREVTGVPPLPEVPSGVKDDLPAVPSEELPAKKVKEKAREPVAA